VLRKRNARMSDSSELVERIRFPELAAALQKDETLSNEVRVKLVNLTNVYSPAHDASYIKVVQTFVGKSLMARAVEQLIKDLRVPENPPYRLVFVDPIEDSDNGERIEYLKRITMEMEKKPEEPKEDIAFDDSDDEEPEPPPAKKPKKQKLDHMELYGSHELVLTHHMQLPAGFTIETDEEQSLQFIVPNRQKPNELKSFRARLAKHLRAIGFVCLEDDAKKDMTECKLPGIHVPERLTHAWARETVDADGKDVSLDPHTLKVKFTGPDPALQLDPLEYL
jgi:hypothetical protein